jgi:NADH-quinone oxidoreductase subunit M
MSLVALIAVPLVGGLLCGLLGRLAPRGIRWLALAASAAVLALGVGLWAVHAGELSAAFAGGGGPWIEQLNVPWIVAFGIDFHLALDGLSLLLVLLTGVLGLACVGISWSTIQRQPGFYYFNLLWTLAGVLGVFLSLDLFLFYFFWELMLVPMYFLILIWGHERRQPAALKFFIFTQAGGLALLAAILALYFLHGRATGQYTFDALKLAGTPLAPVAARLILVGFLAAFLVKLPAVPVHPWLPDAHTQAPTAGSVLLAGLLLKTGAYGLLRFALPLFPSAAVQASPVLLVLAVVGILYGAFMAAGQNDLKRLVAYTSISHMGFVLLGVGLRSLVALQGAVVVMLAHGLATSGLFILAGSVQDRMHTRDMQRMGGFWAPAPRLSLALLFFAMASLGLPGLGNFIGEFLSLLGAWRFNIALAAVSAGGLILATVYTVRMLRSTVFGAPPDKGALPELHWRERAVLAALAVGLFWLGLFPRSAVDLPAPFLRTLAPAAVAGVEVGGLAGSQPAAPPQSAGLEAPPPGGPNPAQQAGGPVALPVGGAP